MIMYIALLRKFEDLSVVYVDDTYLQDESFLKCMHNLENTLAVIQTLGFTIHPDKSQLIPTYNQVIDFKKISLKLTEHTQKKLLFVRRSLNLKSIQSEKLLVFRVYSCILLSSSIKTSLSITFEGSKG